MKRQKAEFVRWMAPLLDALRELGGSGTPREVTERVSRDQAVSDEKRQENLKSGSLRFPNQVAWARQYLVWEGLLDSSKRGVWTLTESGWKATLTPEQSRQIFLKWVAIHAEARKGRDGSEPRANEAEAAPETTEAFKQQHRALLLELLRNLPPPGFERLCGSVHGMDYLLTWNCKHIANAEIRNVVAAVAYDHGYGVPVICTPEELMGE